jgi:hypothetical protein
MAKPVSFPNVTEQKKAGRKSTRPIAPDEKREAALIRLPPFYLRAASTLGSLHGTDRTEVVRAALDDYFAKYPEVIAQVRKAMGEAA